MTNQVIDLTEEEPKTSQKRKAPIAKAKARPKAKAVQPALKMGHLLQSAI